MTGGSFFGYANLVLQTIMRRVDGIDATSQNRELKAIYETVNGARISDTDKDQRFVLSYRP